MMQLKFIPQRRRVLPLAALVFSIGVATFVYAASGQSGTIRSSRSSTQGYLGVDIRDITDEQVSSLKLQNTQGAVIAGMDHDGPACKAGLRVHDVILQMDGQTIDGEQQLRKMLRDTTPGKQVTFVVSRDGQQRTVTSQLANREEVERKAWQNHYVVPDPWSDSTTASNAPSTPSPSPAPVPRRGNSFLHSSPSATPKESHPFLASSVIVSAAYTGAKLEVMGPQLAEFFGAHGSSGLLVREVDAGSPAFDAGLKAGDVVLKVNAQEIVNGSDWSKTIHENRGKPVDLLIVREKKEQTLTLTPDTRKRSKVESDINLEEFFGNSDQASETRATLAELEPIFDRMAEAARRESSGDHVSLFDSSTTRMMSMLHFWSTERDLRHEIELAQQQVHAAAEADRASYHPVVFDLVRAQTRTHLD